MEVHMTKAQSIFIKLFLVGVVVLLFAVVPCPNCTQSVLASDNSNDYTMHNVAVLGDDDTPDLGDATDDGDSSDPTETTTEISFDYYLYVEGSIIRNLTESEADTLPTSSDLEQIGDQNFAKPTIDETKYTFRGWYVQVGDKAIVPLLTREVESEVVYYIRADDLGDMTDVTEIKLLAKVDGISIDYLLRYIDESYSRPFDSSEKQGFVSSYTLNDIKDLQFGIPSFSEVGKYKFLGWTLRIDANNEYNLAKRTLATGVYYYIPSNVDIPSTLTSVIMVARVEIAVYTITYNGLYGSTPPDITSYTKSPDTYINFADDSMKIEVEGYKFEGWYTDNNYTTLAPPITGESYGDVVVWAKCTEIWFDIKFVGASYDDEVVKYGDNAADHIRNKRPEKEGYRFAGWFLNEGYTYIVTDYYIARGPEGKVITFYAKWDKEAGPVLYWIIGGFVALTLISLVVWWIFFRPEQEKID